jgi:hypothetical protein
MSFGMFLGHFTSAEISSLCLTMQYYLQFGLSACLKFHCKGSHLQFLLLNAKILVQKCPKAALNSARLSSYFDFPKI